MGFYSSRIRAELISASLNSGGKIKANTANEKGYAKLASINRGCRIWAHHTLKNELIIDILVTKTADLKYPDIVKSAVDTFHKFAKDNGRQTSNRSWTHSINKSDVRRQYYFEITNDSPETIAALVEAARLAFQKTT